MIVLLDLNKTREDCKSWVDNYVQITTELPVIPRIGETIVLSDTVMAKYKLRIGRVRVVDIEHYTRKVMMA